MKKETLANRVEEGIIDYIKKYNDGDLMTVDLNKITMCIITNLNIDCCITINIERLIGLIRNVGYSCKAKIEYNDMTKSTHIYLSVR